MSREYLMPLPPILVADLFPEVSHRLVALLRSLAPDEWHQPTVSSRRTVKDIASHLLDGSLRRLSMQRDSYRPADGRSQPRAGESLLDFLNRLNYEWETGTRRLSPKVLIDLIEWAFLVWRKACQLTDEGRKRFFQAYEQRKATAVTHPVFGYKMAYGRMVE
jgi:hypothetical protein